MGLRFRKVMAKLDLFVYHLESKYGCYGYGEQAANWIRNTFLKPEEIVAGLY